MDTKQLFERTVEIREASPRPRNGVQQRMADIANSLSRQNENRAIVGVLNEAVLAMTRLCYEADPDGVFCNIDRKTYRILIPAPWGDSGWKRWGLRKWEGGVLRKLLLVRAQMRRVDPVFDYGNSRWYAAIERYSMMAEAVNYWKNNPITLREFRTFADVVRQQARQRVDRRRYGDQ